MAATRRAIALGLGLALWIACAPHALAQEVAYERYRLPNGMTVILHEDHSVPAASINLWYYVASKDEPQGRSGFAHLFEHLMFMGTERVPGSDFDRIMEAGGGFNNASTSPDRTNYYSIGPSELLPTLLWLDADRLEDLGREMTGEKLEKQRAVVRNERRQSYENRPYGRASLKVFELMYPEGHPYHLPVIGTHEDLEAATVDDVKQFFATYYVPSNASLVVAGDFDPEKIKPLIARWFGTLPRGSDVVHAEAGPVRLGRVKRLTMTDAVQYARTTLVYHSPKLFAPGDAEMDLAAAILAEGISSRLYQRLVYRDKLATDVNAYQLSMLLGSLFYVEATARPGVELATIERAIDEEIAALVQRGPTAEELEKQKARIEYATLSRLQSLLAKADLLNHYQFHFDEPNSFRRDLDRYRTATPEGVQRWAKQVLTPGARLILRVIPEIEAPEVSPRDERPAAEAAGAFTPADPASFELANGIRVHHWQRAELPLMRLALLLPRGAANDPAGGAGLAALTAEMLDEGAGKRGAVEFADALDRLGARFDARVDREHAVIDLSGLSRNFEQALELFADAVRRPRFDEKEWQRVHELHVEQLIQAQDEPTVVARNVAMRSLFGEAHPYGRSVEGTPQSARAVTLEQARRHHARWLRPQGAVILSAGDLSPERLKRLLDRALGDWRAPGEAEALAAPSFPSPADADFRVVLVHRPDAVQTVIRFALPGPAYGDPQRLRYELLGTILGGSFTSRLNQNLREEHGYTYGAGCRYSMEPSLGYFTAQSSVRTDVTGAAIGEFLGELRGIRGGNVSAEEARKARAQRRMDLVQSFAGLDGIVEAAVTLVRNGRPFSDLGTELQAVAGIGEGELNAIARPAVPLERGLLVLVGDRRQILGQLDGLELPVPLERTVEGEPVVEPRAAR